MTFERVGVLRQHLLHVFMSLRQANEDMCVCLSVCLLRLNDQLQYEEKSQGTAAASGALITAYCLRHTANSPRAGEREGALLYSPPTHYTALSCTHTY